MNAIAEELKRIADVAEAGGKPHWAHAMRAGAMQIVNWQQRITAFDLAPVAIMDTRDVLGICAPEEDDFPALYALQGKRVRLVLDERPNGEN